jgi:hypothetical protein
VLPNEVKANLAGCFVIGNATGSLAKERVEIQLVSISCVDFDEHSVVDQPVKGFFVDADGKKGLSGKVVTRAGATLARAFIAGTVSGISQSVEGTLAAPRPRRSAACERLMPETQPKPALPEASPNLGKTDRFLSRPRASGQPHRRSRGRQGRGRRDPGRRHPRNQTRRGSEVLMRASTGDSMMIEFHPPCKPAARFSEPAAHHAVRLRRRRLDDVAL